MKLNIGAVKKVHYVEISGACNFEDKCTWCPMHNRPRSRKRGLMSEPAIDRSLYWVKKLGVVEVLNLHLFGEPLLHPKFDEIAHRFSEVAPVTFSTNAALLNEEWANRLAEIKWEWISLSPWDATAAMRAGSLLQTRGIQVRLAPGVTHDFASQAETGRPDGKLFMGCPNLNELKCVIRWDGSVANCPISDREEDVLGTVFQEPEEVNMRRYSLCEGCHHAI